MALKPAHHNKSKAKENLCPTNNSVTDSSLPILNKTMVENKETTNPINNSTPLRQLTLDSSFARRSSPFTERTANTSTAPPEVPAEEIPCKPLTEPEHVEETVAVSPRRPATVQTTLTETTRQTTAKKQSRSTKQKPGKSRSVSARHGSVEQQFAQSGSLRSKGVSVSPRKSVPKQTPADVSAGDACAVEQTAGRRKHQTQLTNYGIRRTARQFAKDMQRERDVNIQHCLRNDIEEGMKIIQTEDKGRGVITTRPFHDDQFIVEYAGELVSEKEAKRREAEYKKDESIGSYMFYFVYNGQKYCVDATAETHRLGRLINHSRLRPNCQVRTLPIDGVPRLALFARRPILPGEELLYDYGDRDKETLEAHPWLKT